MRIYCGLATAVDGEEVVPDYIEPKTKESERNLRRVRRLKNKEEFASLFMIYLLK